MSHISLIVTDLSYNRSTNCFSAEISELEHKSVFVNIRSVKSITLRNLRIRRTRLFTLYKVDMDGSQEDIYGWNFVSSDGTKLLIIND